MSALVRRMMVAVSLVGLWSLWQLSAPAQSPTGSAPLKPAAKGSRFEFDVVESFDAKYLGDTPGHVGRSGGLDDVRPHVALGDGVFRGNQRIGSVTNVFWERGKGSLTVEFDPEPFQRVAVGDQVWLALDGTQPDDKK